MEHLSILLSMNIIAIIIIGINVIIMVIKKTKITFDNLIFKNDFVVIAFFVISISLGAMVIIVIAQIILTLII